MKGKRNGWIILALVMILAAVGAGGYFVGENTAASRYQAQREKEILLSRSEWDGLGEIEGPIYVTGHKSPDSDTVGSAIAHKDIELGDQKATLIVVGIRGGNYKNEWQSNLTLNIEMRHQGFNQAATLVTDRILSYVGQHEFNHPLKVWIAGYSRAGAVTNLVAANLNDSPMFTQDQIYAYTFAAPRPVCNNSTPTSLIEGYENIFNVVGASDFIPQFVPAEWGYGHYGIDKELPGAEFDSTFSSKYEVVFKQLQQLGINSYYNPQLNLRVRMLYGLLLEIAHNEIDFMFYLQPILLKILQNSGANNILLLLRETLLEWKKEYPELSEKIDQVIDFGVETIRPLIAGGSYVTNQQSTSINPLFRLVHEHFPEQYLYLLYNFKASELYGTASEFAYIAFSGGALVVKEGQNEVLRVKNGQKSLTPYATSQKIDMSNWLSKGKDVLVLPYDRDYTVQYEVDANGKFECWVLPYGRTFSSKLNKMTTEATNNGTLLQIQGKKASYTGTSSKSTPTEFITYIGIQNGIMPYRLYIFLLGLVPGVLIALFMWLFVFIHSRIVKTKIHPGRLGLLSLFAILVVEGEFAFWFFSDLIWAGALMKAGAALCILILYLIGKKPAMFKRPDKTILPFLLLALAGNVVLSINFPVGVGLLIGALAFLSFYHLRNKQMRANQWLVFGVLTVLVTTTFLIFLSPVDVGVFLTVISIVAALLVALSSSRQGGNKGTIGFVTLLAMVCLGLYLHAAFAVLCSILYVGLFSVGMVLYVLYYDLPKGEEDKKADLDQPLPLLEEGKEVA